MEKLLITSNFSFSHNVFYPIWHLFFYFECTLKCHLQFVWDQSKILSSGNGLIGYHTITQFRLLMTVRKKPLENIVGKVENAGNQHFLLFPRCFLPFQCQISIVCSHLFCRLQMLSIWSCPKMCRLVKS